MKPSSMISAVAFAMGLLACEQHPLAGPEVQPLVLGAAPAGQAAPLIFVDGRRVASSSLRQLDSSIIKTIEVMKGAEAVRRYGDGGRRGVILIHTK